MIKSREPEISSVVSFIIFYSIAAWFINFLTSFINFLRSNCYFGTSIIFLIIKFFFLRKIVLIVFFAAIKVAFVFFFIAKLENFLCKANIFGHLIIAQKRNQQFFILSNFNSQNMPSKFYQIKNSFLTNWLIKKREKLNCWFFSIISTFWDWMRRMKTWKFSHVEKLDMCRPDDCEFAIYVKERRS